MINIRHRGSLDNTTRFLKTASFIERLAILGKYGQLGVDALERATPKDTGYTAGSWKYEVISSKQSDSISWTNSSVHRGIPIVILLQYGHATRSGSFIQGRDFINPTMQPIFDEIVSAVWKEVTNA